MKIYQASTKIINFSPEFNYHKMIGLLAFVATYIIHYYTSELCYWFTFKNKMSEDYIIIFT